jgi:hypothetical protein
MASELKVDKFTGVTTAGSIDVTGEGNSTTTNLQQGLCKAFISFDGGQYTYTFSNNMSNANFNVAHASGNQMQIHSLSATSSVRTLNRDGSNNNEDANPAFSNVHGDLA